MAKRNLAAVSKWGRINVVNPTDVKEGVIIEFKDTHLDNSDAIIRQYYRNEYGTIMSEDLAEFEPAEFKHRNPEKTTKKLRKLISNAFGKEKTRIFIDRALVQYFEIDEEDVEIKEKIYEEAVLRGVI